MSGFRFLCLFSLGFRGSNSCPLSARQVLYWQNCPTSIPIWSFGERINITYDILDVYMIINQNSHPWLAAGWTATAPMFTVVQREGNERRENKTLPEVKDLISLSRILLLALIIVLYGHLNSVHSQAMRKPDFIVQVRHCSHHYAVFTCWLSPIKGRCWSPCSRRKSQVLCHETKKDCHLHGVQVYTNK